MKNEICIVSPYIKNKPTMVNISNPLVIFFKGMTHCMLLYVLSFYAYSTVYTVSCIFAFISRLHCLCHLAPAYV